MPGQLAAADRRRLRNQLVPDRPERGMLEDLPDLADLGIPPAPVRTQAPITLPDDGSGLDVLGRGAQMLLGPTPLPTRQMVDEAEREALPAPSQFERLNRAAEMLRRLGIVR